MKGRIRSKMRISMAVLAILFASLLLVVGCGEQKSESSSEPPSEANAPPTTGPETSRKSTVSITNTEGEMVVVRVEIATTTAEKQRGLMGRTALAEDAGMLFVFDREQQLSFWMKDTLIPLSIAYINESGRIVDIQDMKPLDETPHPSAEPAKYALEVNQGFFNEHGVEVGNKVSLPGE
jgi:uncharacterized membrane protein (UPF0127 family)